MLPRPRRFGKTLNLSMLRYFFEKSEEDRSGLFDGLFVRNDEVFAAHQGRYPVIYLTFKDMKGITWENLYEGLRKVISEEIERHIKVLESDGLSATNRNYLKSLIMIKGSRRSCEDSLRILSENLSCCYNEQTVILLDEYDTPLHAGYANGYYDEVVSFMRNFLSGGLKDNESLFKRVITGILRVAKESIFSGLNNLGGIYHFKFKIFSIIRIYRIRGTGYIKKLQNGQPA